MMHTPRIASAVFRPAAAGAVVTAAMLALPQSARAATPVTEVVAVSGEAAPGDNGEFVAFTAPVLNGEGEAGFAGILTGTDGGTTDNAGLFRGDALTLVEVVRKGEDAPDDNGTFSDFASPALNEAGQEAFFGILTGTANGTADNQGIFRGDGATLVQIAREGQDAPDNNGAFASFGNFPSFNNVGQAAFSATLRDTSGGGDEENGIFRGDGVTLVQIARGNQAAPDGQGNFDRFDPNPALNDAGQVAFRGFLDNTSDTEGIFRGDGAALVQVARMGEDAPGGGTFTTFLAPSLNDVGQVAFTGGVTTDGTNDLGGVFRGDGATLVQIAREGQDAPDDNGTFSVSFRVPTINDAGQVVFQARLAGTSEGSTDDDGIFRGDGVTLEQLAREGEASPDGNGVFAGFLDPAFNDAGQAAFQAFLTGTDGGSSDDSGIFFYDDTLGLVPVVREGDELLGSTITRLAFESSLGTRSDERSGLNELGEVAYHFTLADGRQGVAISAVPEPGAVGLLAVGGVALLRRGRRR